MEIKPYQHSDHDATIMTLDLQKQKRGDGYWHFNNVLLNDEQFTNDINKLGQNGESRNKVMKALLSDGIRLKDNLNKQP